MGEHGGWGGHGDYSFEEDRGPFPNLLDIASNIAYKASQARKYFSRKPKEQKDPNRTTISEAMGCIVVGGIFLAYEGTRKVLSLPKRGLERFFRNRVQDIGRFEDEDLP